MIGNRRERFIFNLGYRGVLEINVLTVTPVSQKDTQWESGYY